MKSMWLLSAWTLIGEELNTLRRKKRRKDSKEALDVFVEIQYLVDCGDLPKVPWTDRKELAADLIRNDCYRDLAVADSMTYLLQSLPQTDEEKQWLEKEVRAKGTSTLQKDLGIEG